MNSILPFCKKYSEIFYCLCFLLFGINFGWSQTTTVFSESFDRGSVVQPLTNGGTPSMTYTTATTATGSASASGATSRTNLNTGTDYALQILPGNSSATPTAQTAGQTYVTGSLSTYSSPFNATLSSNSGPITWTFNMKTNRSTALSGFAAGSYGSAVVLAATSSTLHTVGNGYAVIEVKGTTTNTLKLIKYTNGLGGTQTVIVAPASDFLAANASWASVRVVYTPSNNNWQLFLRDDTTAPVSPLSGVTTQAGSTVSDNTYTGTASSIFGFYFNHSTIGTPTSNTALFDNFSIKIDAPSLTTSSSSLSSFNYLLGSGPSTFQSFTVSGANLSGNAVITAPTNNYEVCLTSGGTYTNTVSITPSSGTISAVSVFVRLKAGLAVNSYSESLTVVSGSTSATSVACSGSVSPLTPNIVTGSLAAFANRCINTTSSSNTFTISGTNLTTDPITVGPLSGFTFSTDGTNFSSSLSLTQSGGTYGPTTISVQFTPTAASSYNGNISVGGGGTASAVSVAATGSGINTAATTANGSASAITSASATVAGTSTAGCSSVTVVGIEYSTTNGFTNGTGTKVPGTGSASFSSSLTSLSANTTYYYKSYVIDGTGTIYAASQSSFTTLNIDAPVATAATSITSNSFVANWGTVSAASSYLFDVLKSEKIAEWTFPASGTTLTADNTSNANNTASALTLSSGTVTDVTGLTTRAASGTAWTTLGKYWEISVNTTGSYNLTISSVQNSSGSGPRDFKLQYKIGVGGTYTDVPSGAITVANDYLSGLVTNLALPSACDNQASVYIRWITTSTTNTGGTAITSGGTSRIDNILVKGITPLTGYNNLSVPTNSKSVSGLSPLSDYFYRVRATNASSTSVNSNLIAVTTRADETVADYRSKATGNFSDASTWEYFDNVAWSSASVPPTSANNITIVSPNEVALTADITVGTGKTLTVNGILNAAGKVVSGLGSFSLASGATVKLGDNVSLGTAVTTTTKTFDAGANYIYNGTVAQTTASLPGTVTGNITIANAAGVTFTANKAVNSPGTFAVTNNGNVVFGNGANTVYYVSGTGAFSANSGSTFVLTNSNGITSDGLTGNIRLTGTRTFAAGINYNFTKNDATTFLASNMGSSFGTEITSINNLTVNNPNGVILPTTVAPINTSGTPDRDITIDGVLTFTSGNIVTGTNKVIISSSGSVVRTSGHVVGNLQRAVAADISTVAFPIGDASNYTPVSLAFESGNSAGNVTVSTAISASAPAVVSTISQYNYIKRNWTLSFSATPKYSATFTYINSSDIAGTPLLTSLKVGKLTSGSWTNPTGSSASPSATTSTGLISGGTFSLGGDLIPPVINNSTLSASSTYGSAGSFQISATNSPTSYNATAIGGGALPTGFTVDTATGLISVAASTAANSYTIIISATNADGTGSSATLTYTVNRATVTITPISGQSKTYGAANPTYGYAASPIPDVSITGALGRVVGENVNTYAYSLGDLSAGSNYALVLGGSATFAITQATVTITPTSGQSKTYGAADPTYTYTASPTPDVSITGALGRVAGENVNAYAYTLGDLSAGSNYSLVLGGSNTFSITSALLTITPTSAQSKTYGANDPSYTYTASPTPDVSITGALGRVAGENVNTYAYSLGDLSAGSNYSLVLGGSTAFAITPALLTITATNQSKCQGQTFIFDGATMFTITPSTLPNGETVGSVTLTSSGSSSGALAGSYSIIPSAAIGGTFTASNYTITYATTGVLTVNPSPTSTISAGGSTTFCSGGSVVLTSSTGNSYLWSNGATTQSITVSTSGSFTVQVTNSFGCLSAASAATTVTVTSQPQWYLDADGDGYYTGVPIASCTSPGTGYTTSVTGGGDCNDAVATINPGVTEICYNNIDDNCNGTLSEGCAPVVVNMTPSYNNTTLVSLSIAIPAVGYSYSGTSNIKYRFSITNVTTNVTSADIIQTSRYVTIPASLHVYGATYTIKVSAVINDEVVPFYGNTITVTGPTVQLITLSSASCGATLASLSSTISANDGLNATGYTFRIRLTSDSGPTPTYGYSSSATRFVGANTFAGFPLQYNTSYKVAVKYTYNDPVTSLPVEAPYGAECTVSTPSIPLIGLAAPTCGSQVATINAGITASPAAYATGYRFRIRMTTDNGPTPTYYYSLPNASRFSSLVAFQGITLAYNTQYSIAVEYSILTNSVTQWSGFGSECIVQTPFFPTTSLVPSQCGLATPTSLTQQLNITPYPGFPNYKVKLDEISGESITNSQEIVISYSNFRLNQFSIAQLGKNYNVSVAIKLNGVFGDYSTACDLFTAAPSRTVELPFKASAYPNPFANNFMLDVTTSSKSVVGVKVYDMVGRLIEQREVNVSDMENTTIGDRYPSGVYNVVVSQEGSVEIVRVVKR
ncbi:MBG domain-containing protein [Flavobacterium sp. N1994]|uniref:MBG domain-containing protein n=1 Tax=Flavobacterium sp. N1994 TaxID=2986827 RepID=UPI00222309ED|nr:MBG domain-containing protein [Flavobacterium sp. N1994]